MKREDLHLTRRHQDNAERAPPSKLPGHERGTVPGRHRSAGNRVYPKISPDLRSHLSDQSPRLTVRKSPRTRRPRSRCESESRPPSGERDGEHEEVPVRVHQALWSRTDHRPDLTPPP